MKHKRNLLLSLLLACGLCLLFTPAQAEAKSARAKKLVLTTSTAKNINYINEFLSGNKKKTLVFPKGSTTKLNGMLRPGNNTTIIATGATVYGKSASYAIFAEPNKNVKNLTIKGGTWRSIDKDGRGGSVGSPSASLLAFAFVDGLTIDGIDVNANYKGHSIEVIACKNVTIKNCKVSAIGSNPSDCKEEQIQIDLATRTTAPRIAEYGSQYAQGQTCENVKILNNKIKGARAVGINYVSSDGGKWLNQFHRNIVIKGNTLTGTTSEALSYFNVIGGKICNNKITTKATRSSSNYSYTIGIHVAIFGKAPQKEMNASTLKISNNTVKGYRNGIHFKAYFNSSESQCLSQLGNVSVTNNKVYCKMGKANAIAQVKNSCKKLTLSKNKTYDWK